MSELLLPKVDFVFKRIFGTEENKDVLITFLNAVFKPAPGKELTDIEILNPYIDKEALSDKLSILDIRARTADGTLINIEIQLVNRFNMEKRTLYYWSKMYAGQLSEGQDYRELKKTVTINILDFVCLPGKRYHHVFHLREDREPELVLSDDLEIHFLELPKLEVEAYSLGDNLVKWLLFIRGIEKERWEELAQNEPALKKAMTTLEFLSQDREARMLYEMRQKALHDLRSMTEGAKAEGEAIGLQRGEVIATRAAVVEFLEGRFGECPLEVAEKLENITDLGLLKELRRKVFRADTLEQAQKIIQDALG